jgi:hypothetical protein
MAIDKSTLGALDITNCDVGVKINDTDYDLTVNSVQHTTQKQRHKIRGANSNSKDGVTFTENNSQPDTYTISIVAISLEILNLINNQFTHSKDIGFYVLDRDTGKGFVLDNCTIQSKVIQENIAEGEEALGCTLTLESFE